MTPRSRRHPIVIISHIYMLFKAMLKPIKTISRCLTIFVLQILASSLLRCAILKSLIYFDIGFKLNGKFSSTYDSL